MKIEFRPINADDISRLKSIATETFIQSYEHLNKPTNFKDYLEKAFTKSKLLAEVLNEESYYYFIISGGDVLGYLKLNIGSSQSENFDDDYMEIERIYLLAQYHRMGIGRKMMNFVFEQAGKKGKKKVWLGVWRRNPNAIEFYKRMGFQITGDHIFKFGDEDQVDLIMEVDLSDL